MPSALFGRSLPYRSRPRRTRVPARIGAAVVAWSLAVPHVAHARYVEPADAKDDAALERAMEVYESGKAHFQKAEYEEALADFQEASTLFASPDFQYNIGRCYEELDRYEDAVRAFEIYLRAKPNAADAGDVRERIGRLRGLIEAQKQAEQNEEDAQSEEADAPPPVVAQPPVQDEPAPPPGRAMVISGSVLIGLGAALGLGGGIGLGFMARERSDELDEIQTGGNPQDATLADAQEIEDAGRSAEIGQIATAAAGGAIAIGGVVLLVLGLQRNKKGQAEAASVHVVPQWSSRFGGLSLRGRF